MMFDTTGECCGEDQEDENMPWTAADADNLLSVVWLGERGGCCIVLTLSYNLIAMIKILMKWMREKGQAKEMQRGKEASPYISQHRHTSGFGDMRIISLDQMAK